MTSPAGHRPELEVAVAAARAAAAHVRANRPGATSNKRRNDIVTDVDLASEQIILGRLRDAFPADAIVSEEAGSLAGRSRRTWYVDPLDGTANFAAGLPHYAVAITLVDREEVVLAATHDVVRDLAFTASADDPTAIDGRRIEADRAGCVEDALIALQLPEPAWRADSEIVDLVNSARGFRASGSEALDFAWTAAGFLDACLYRRTAAGWDWRGGELLVRRAGGVVASLGAIDGIPLMVAGASGVVDALRSRTPWHPR